MTQSRLTTIGKLFVILALVFYIASITSQSGLLLLFIGLIIGCILVNWFYSKRAAAQIDIQAPSEVWIAEGSRVDQPWRVTNLAKHSVELIEIHSSAGRLFRIGQLRRKDSLTVKPDLVYHRRGVYSNDRIRIICAAPFGLVRTVHRMSMEGQVIVHPRLFDAPVPLVAGLDSMPGGKHTGNRRLTSGANFAGVRSWQPGDPIKQIDWKSTAKRQELMVKTFEEELSGRLAILIDCEGTTPEESDDCVRAAGSLLFSSLDAGHQVEFFDGDKKRVLPPFSDVSELLHLLARYEPVRINELFWESLPDQISRKSAVALVVVEWKPLHEQLVRRLVAQGRKLSVYLSHKNVSTTPKGIEHLFYFDPHRIWHANNPHHATA